jgi:hypothetical protein
MGCQPGQDQGDSSLRNAQSHVVSRTCACDGPTVSPVTCKADNCFLFAAALADDAQCVAQEAREVVHQQHADEQERVMEALQCAAGRGFDYCKVSQHATPIAARALPDICDKMRQTHAPGVAAARPCMAMLGAPVVKVRAGRSAWR